MVSEPNEFFELPSRGADDFGPSASLVQNAVVNLAGVFVAALIVAVAGSWKLMLGWDFVASAILPLALAFALVLRALPAHPHSRFGYANLVTAVRAALVSLMGASVLFFDDLARTDALLWTLVAVAVFALMLDGVDGCLARRYRQVSEFGARFDMEVDAMLILILSIASASFGKAGLWVVVVGLMRYGFVVAQWFLPKLAADLFPSLRRKLVCVLQIAGLCIALMPSVTPDYSAAIAAFALAMLVYSFAVDIRYLLRRPNASDP